MLKLLIAIDGSEHAKHAIEAVAKMVRAGIALEAILLNVRDPPAVYSDVAVISIDEIVAAQKQAQDHELGEAEALALGCGLKLRPALRAVGRPASEIVRLATEHGVDQIVMGTHGRGVMGSLFLGSVAQRVVHLSQVPVLLVK